MSIDADKSHQNQQERGAHRKACVVHHGHTVADSIETKAALEMVLGRGKCIVLVKARSIHATHPYTSAPAPKPVSDCFSLKASPGR